MTETYSHTFASGRVCTLSVRYRDGQIPVIRCTNPLGDLAPGEYEEYLQWRKHVAVQTLLKLDPIAVAKLAFCPDEEESAP